MRHCINHEMDISPYKAYLSMLAGPVTLDANIKHNNVRLLLPSPSTQVLLKL